MKLYHLLISFAVLSIWSCTGIENKNLLNPKSDVIFFDYKISGYEGDSNVTVYIQFKRGGTNGRNFFLDDPATIQLDGETIPADTARVTGAYYEIQKPFPSFIGEHTITFTSPGKKEYKEEFEYRPFRLKKELPPIIHRNDLTLDFKDLSQDPIRVSAIDTSFSSRDIVEIDTTKNGRLVIPTSKLKNLVNGPIVLLLSSETEKHVEHGQKVWGRIEVSYGLQRQFELK